MSRLMIACILSIGLCASACHSPMVQKWVCPEPVEAMAGPAAAASQPTAAAGASTATTTPDWLQKIKGRREQLEQRQIALDRREAQLVLAEQELEKRGKVIGKCAPATSNQNFEKLEGIVTEMKVRPAAQFVAALPDAEAAAIVMSLAQERAAELLAAMPADKAAHIMGRLTASRGDGSHAH